MTGDTLKTDAFRAAWESWERYRRERGAKLTPTTISRQIKKLEAWGHDVAIASIEQSIGHGWQGLFAPRDESGQPAKPKPKRTPEQQKAYYDGLGLVKPLEWYQS